MTTPKPNTADWLKSRGWEKFTKSGWVKVINGLRIAAITDVAIRIEKQREKEQQP